MKAGIKNHIRQLESVYSGNNWYGESFTDKLANLREEDAFRQPAPGRHSVAEILWHCIYWRLVLIKFMQGDTGFRKRTSETQNFLSREELLKNGWKNLLDKMKETQEVMIGLLSPKDDSFLELEYPGDSKIGIVLEGIIQHDIYHLGQIGYVISLLNLNHT